MKPLYLAALIALGSLWGASFMFIKLGLDSYAPATIVALRMGGSALVLSLLLRVQRQRFPRSLHIWRDLIVVGVVGMVIPFTLISWGEQYIPSSLAAIGVATTPLFTLLLAYVWTRDERLSLVQTGGVLLGFGGVAVAMNLREIDVTAGSTQGRFAVLGATCCYGFAAIYGRRAFRGLPAMLSATGTMICGTLCIIPVALLLDGLPTPTPTGQALVGVVGLTLLSTALAYILYYWILERLGSARTAMVTYLVPVFALLFGWLWLGENIGIHTVVGLGLVLTGILIANGVIFQQRTVTRPHLEHNPIE